MSVRCIKWSGPLKRLLGRGVRVIDPGRVLSSRVDRRRKAETAETLLEKGAGRGAPGQDHELAGLY